MGYARRCRENGFSRPSPYITATYAYRRNEHETGVSIHHRVASTIAHEANKIRFILVIVGCGRVAKNFFCRRVEVSVSRPLRILSAHETVICRYEGNSHGCELLSVRGCSQALKTLNSYVQKNPFCSTGEGKASRGCSSLTSFEAQKLLSVFTEILPGVSE